MSCFKILNPIELRTRQVSMGSWGVPELEKLCNHFGKDLQIDEKKICALINVDATKRKFFSYKVHPSTEWHDKIFNDVWSMISWNQSLRGKYENLRILARVQCVSTAQCERAFSIENRIKTKTRNKLDTKHLECIMRVSMEDLCDDLDNVLMEAIALWRNSTKFKWLFSHPQTYLSGRHFPLESEDDTMDFDSNN